MYYGGSVGNGWNVGTALLTSRRQVSPDPSVGTVGNGVEYEFAFEALSGQMTVANELYI